MRTGKYSWRKFLMPWMLILWLFLQKFLPSCTDFLSGFSHPHSLFHFLYGLSIIHIWPHIRAISLLLIVLQQQNALTELESINTPPSHTMLKETASLFYLFTRSESPSTSPHPSVRISQSASANLVWDSELYPLSTPVYNYSIILICVLRKT